MAQEVISPNGKATVAALINGDGVPVKLHPK